MRFGTDADHSRPFAGTTKQLWRYRRDGARARQRLDASVQPDVLPTGEPSAFALICHEDELQRLRSAIREVPDDSAHLLHLRYWEEQDTSEIARLLELEPGAVRTRLHRARHRMKRVLAAMTRREEQPAVETEARVRPARRGRCPTSRGRIDRENR